MPDDESNHIGNSTEELHIDNITEHPYTNESIGFLGKYHKPETNESNKERSRFWVVLSLLLAIFFILIIPFVMLAFCIELTEKHWEYLHIAFPALLGVFGSAATFYFERR